MSSRHTGFMRLVSFMDGIGIAARKSEGSRALGPCSSRGTRDAQSRVRADTPIAGAVLDVADGMSGNDASHPPPSARTSATVA